MLIKYRCGVVHSSRNIRFRNRISKVIGRSTTHMRNSFTFKRSAPRWRPTIRVHRSEQVADVAIMNNVVTLTHSEPVSWISIFGMFCFLYLFILTESFGSNSGSVRNRLNIISCVKHFY